MKMDEFLKITGAINDSSRVLVLAFLARYGELCVCDLQVSLDMHQSRLSRHLKILREANFLYVIRRGLFAYYGIKKDLTLYHRQTLEAIACLDLSLPELKRQKNDEIEC